MSSPKEVGVGLTVLGFRRDLFELDAEYRKNAECAVADEIADPGGLSDDEYDELIEAKQKADPRTDIIELVKRAPNIIWSAPKQDLNGGALFFYLGRRALKNVAACLRQAQAWYSEDELAKLQVLEQTKKFIDRYHGTVFGVAPVESAPIASVGAGFRGRVFAKIDSKRWHLFESPLPYADLESILPIYGQTVAALEGDKGDRLRRALTKNNDLPAWLAQMKFGTGKFSQIDPKNWLREITAPHLFAGEGEQAVRSYFHDFVLAEIRDEDTPLLAECECFRAGVRTGIADYFVCIAGQWIPVESKIAISAEADVLGQVGKYVDIDCFRVRATVYQPSVSRGKLSIPGGAHKVALLADQYGFYLSVGGEFVDCNIGRPLWRRTEFSRTVLRTMRERLSTLVGSVSDR